MGFNPFSFRNVFCGVVLGIVVVIVWLFHGEIWAYLQTQAPEMKAIIRTAVHEHRNTSEAEITDAAPETPERPSPTAVMEPEQSESPAPVIEPLEPEAPITAQGAPDEAPAASHEEPLVTRYPFRTFDSAGPARRFVASIRESTGVELQVERQAHRYVVLIPALDETEKERKAALIRKKAGVRE